MSCPRFQYETAFLEALSSERSRRLAAHADGSCQKATLDRHLRVTSSRPSRNAHPRRQLDARADPNEPLQCPK